MLVINLLNWSVTCLVTIYLKDLLFYGYIIWYKMLRQVYQDWFLLSVARVVVTWTKRFISCSSLIVSVVLIMLIKKLLKSFPCQPIMIYVIPCVDTQKTIKWLAQSMSQLFQMSSKWNMFAAKTAGI